jgi:diaminohydroxyphosphoribosylaminopyrimidine deaminase/5-amino-6-(5-phosphoribosylamino)uracil reductase
MVGVGTVLADDPELTVRLVRGEDPMRVVLDSRLRTGPGARVIEHRSKAPTLVLHASDASETRRRRLMRDRVELVEIPRSSREGLDLRAALRYLAGRGVVRLLCEGGPRVHGELLDSGLADRVALFIAPRILGDARALPLACGRKAVSLSQAWRIREAVFRKLAGDLLVTGRLERTQS